MNPVSHCLDQASVSLIGLAAMSPSPHIKESQMIEPVHSASLTLYRIHWHKQAGQTELRSAPAAKSSKFRRATNKTPQEKRVAVTATLPSFWNLLNSVYLHSRRSMSLLSILFTRRRRMAARRYQL